jgi:hypothetical protein
MLRSVTRVPCPVDARRASARGGVRAARVRAAPRRTARVCAMAVAAGASRVATVTKQAAGGLDVQVTLGIDGSGSVEWCAQPERRLSCVALAPFCPQASGPPTLERARDCLRVHLVPHRLSVRLRLPAKNPIGTPSLKGGVEVVMGVGWTSAFYTLCSQPCGVQLWPQLRLSSTMGRMQFVMLLGYRGAAQLDCRSWTTCWTNWARMGC